ncbi:hypothetical protein ANN_10895 [Periplaneta americana]|uniref:Uncharacterized protein n=1 Tax=Periplaneta americana TaxID=6978 RepID=A0ABQ8T4W7_PERAM|nr:hypothetical protein ANN_10895 [Periplaneta americana]
MADLCEGGNESAGSLKANGAASMTGRVKGFVAKVREVNLTYGATTVSFTAKTLLLSLFPFCVRKWIKPHYTPAAYRSAMVITSYIKDRVFVPPKPRNIGDIRQRNIAAVDTIARSMLMRVARTT